MGSASSSAVPGAEPQVPSWKAGAPLITPETTCTQEFVALNVGGTRAAKSDYTAHAAQGFVGADAPWCWPSSRGRRPVALGEPSVGGRVRGLVLHDTCRRGRLLASTWSESGAFVPIQGLVVDLLVTRA